MTEIKKTTTTGLMLALAYLALGCDPGGGEVLRFHHAGQEYQLSYDRSPDGLVLRDGPDNERLVQLFLNPRSGYAPDPTEKDTYWLYVNDQERDQVSRQLIERTRRPAARNHDDNLRSDSGFVQFYRDRSYGGQAFEVDAPGEVDDFRDFIGWDHAIASLKIYDAEVLLYELPNLSGHSLMLLSDEIEICLEGGAFGCRSERHVPTLERYEMKLVFRGRGLVPITWYKQASSALFLPAR